MTTTLLFDIDGTLMDTEEVMVKSLQATLKEQKNLTVPTHDLDFILGIPGKKALEKFSPSESEIAFLHECWVKNVERFLDYAKIFPGIRELLSELKKMAIPLGVVTSKTNQSMKTEFEPYGLSDYFATVVTASHTEKHKPNPEPINLALELSGAKKAQAIYIGDSIYDMQSAHAAGIDFALAKWGAKENTEFAQADIILAEPNDLLKYIER
ncbi:HAD family hydrolase [Enterococcus gilvus]|uniref:HAD family hydrolase n=1 Tax=Enterococcus gilvus TaxID=160453 RepID=UPI001C8BB0FC|nr:HAD family hydrolase [Enterococcus gilvus]MBX8937404.1 HAD family hydrolase [Enterococcus gilvus]